MVFAGRVTGKTRPAPFMFESFGSVHSMALTLSKPFGICWFNWLDEWPLIAIFFLGLRICLGSGGVEVWS